MLPLASGGIENVGSISLQRGKTPPKREPPVCRGWRPVSRRRGSWMLRCPTASWGADACLDTFMHHLFMMWVPIHIFGLWFGVDVLAVVLTRYDQSASHAKLQEIFFTIIPIFVHYLFSMSFINNDSHFHLHNYSICLPNAMFFLSSVIIILCFTYSFSTFT